MGRFVPIPEINKKLIQSPRGRHRRHVRSLEIDHQLELGRLLDGQPPRIGALMILSARAAPSDRLRTRLHRRRVIFRVS